MKSVEQKRTGLVKVTRMLVKAANHCMSNVCKAVKAGQSDEWVMFAITSLTMDCKI
jgi:hypothetical protein